MLKEELDELVSRNVKPLRNGTVGFGPSLDEINAETNKWIYDVKIFAERYLKRHPLYDNIRSTIFHKSIGVVGELKSCLTAIQDDKAFFSSSDISYSKTVKTSPNRKYDLFLSHASKDKEDYVNDLFSSLKELGINIFYDTEVIQWGDNWKNKILDGVAKSEFAIIVISKNFFDREWTEKELNELLSRQNESKQKMVLPILKDISIKELREKYPQVADIQAIDSRDYSCNQIAIKFAKILIERIKGQ